VHHFGLIDRLLESARGIIAEAITLVDSPIEVGIDLRWPTTRRCWRRRPRSAPLRRPDQLHLQRDESGVRVCDVPTGALLQGLRSG